ncbi:MULTISPECIES: TolC family protein [Achromobacter]|uniref:TolC family protein n=1 Tax=Achromobacter TaxID=222 RepID=UPI0024495974|nr:TolC family protein [Achromobacter animicus]MDH0684825.1 TolC family protein [Achromobacter animicus]
MRVFLPPLAVAALLFVGAAGAQGTEPSGAFLSNPAPTAPEGAAANRLTLAQAMEAALERNPALAAARHEANAADGQVTQAGLLPNPSLDVSVDDTQKATRTTTTMLSMPVELGGKRAARVAAAQLSRDIARQDEQGARATLRSAVVTAFFNVAVAQEAVRVTQVNVDIAASAQRLAERRVAAGKAPPLESGKAGVALANARIEARAAQAELLEARRSLAVLWGDNDPDFESVTASVGALPEREPLDDLRASLAQSPFMEAGRMAVDLGQAQLEVEKSKRYPDVTLSAGVARDNEAGRNKTQLGISIPLPLIDRNQGNVYTASMQAYKAKDTYRDLQASLTADLLRAVTQFDLAVSAARDYRESVIPGANQAYESARKGFEAGKFGFLEVLDAQRTFSEGNIAYLKVVASAYQAHSDIQRLLGR